MGDGERLVDVLLDQKHGDAARVDLPDDVEVLLDQQRRPSEGSSMSRGLGARINPRPMEVAINRNSWSRSSGARRKRIHGLA